ncbi:MAG: energy-coupling factor transporter transmembrane protein EcfT [Desulfobacteraceae bacterium]|nr:energy-coupling factor transporter transmembrane protein EcfT [Pseudomonadota bacterium]MCG2755860.1 energy-coupling factor transporter transmembrane protein EcfT [Desulfobacteraceae bacterium]
MAELTAFHFRPGTSLLHTLDVRFKILSFVLISISSFKAYTPALFILTLVLFYATLISRLPFKSILKELRYFFVLLVFILIVRAVFTPTSPVVDFKQPAVAWQGIYDGALVCWRLLLVVLFGLIFVSTTRPSDIRTAVEWFLMPFPFIPGKRVATMMSLIMRFVPLILDQARETIDAQRSRGVENRKNPVYRLIKLVIPLMIRTFKKADKLAVAMEARCYSEKRTNKALLSVRSDWITIFGVICLSILLSIIDT